MKQKSKDYIVKRGIDGLGLFALRDFKKGEFVIEYTGEKITTDEANNRGGKYLFEISKQWHIDGKGRENTARYINHSCKPNAEVDIKKGRILISTISPVKEGQEFTYDYGKEYFDEFIKPKGCRCEKHMPKK